MDIDTLRKSRRVIGKLEKEIEDLKGNIFFFIKNLDESNVGVSQFYLTMLNYLEDLTQSLEYISKAGFKHVNNNHKKLRFNQIKDLKDVEQIMHSLFAEIQIIFENKSYQNIVPLLVKREILIEEINNHIEKQVTRTRLDESSPKNTALYFSILSETKDLLAATMNLMELYDQHAHRA
jgi:Na+/phosphate symporter